MNDEPLLARMCTDRRSPWTKFVVLGAAIAVAVVALTSAVVAGLLGTGR